MSAAVVVVAAVPVIIIMVVVKRVGSFLEGTAVNVVVAVVIVVGARRVLPRPGRWTKGLEHG